jgi:hypothetical protein
MVCHILQIEGSIGWPISYPQQLNQGLHITIAISNSSGLGLNGENSGLFAKFVE